MAQMGIGASDHGKAPLKWTAFREPSRWQPGWPIPEMGWEDLPNHAAGAVG